MCHVQVVEGGGIVEGGVDGGVEGAVDGGVDGPDDESVVCAWAGSRMESTTGFCHFGILAPAPAITPLPARIVRRLWRRDCLCFCS